MKYAHLPSEIRLLLLLPTHMYSEHEANPSQSANLALHKDLKRGGKLV